MNNSDILFERAKNVMPGGVNSPVRAFNAVGRNPIFIKSGKGCHVTDQDGNAYVDFIGSWGPMILGHSHKKIISKVTKTLENGISFGAATELEVDMAELIVNMVKSIEMVRMVNSGTEAVMSALRLARGYTKKDKIIKFAGCYHGHVDSMLVKAGSGGMTFGCPNSDGVTEGTARDTLIAKYNSIESVEILFAENKNQIAAIIVEPVAANMGVVLPKDGFLQSLRKLCDENNALLIFDEVITGFRLAKGGAQEYFNIDADIVTYGKIIGGGMPVGAYGGKKEIMKNVGPLGKVYQAGTLSGNPIAMTAGIATLQELNNSNLIYDNLSKIGNDFFGKLNQNKNIVVNHIGSIGTVFFNKNIVCDYESSVLSDTKKYAACFNKALDNGIYMAPSQFEAMFLGTCHTKEILDMCADIMAKILKEMD